MTPQSYCNLIINYVNRKSGMFMCIEDKIFTEENLYNYCISHADRLDEGDTNKIRFIVQEVLKRLNQLSYISLCDGVYEVKKRVKDDANIIVFSKFPEMKNHTQEQLQKFNRMDKSLHDNDPAFKFGKKEDENILGK